MFHMYLLLSLLSCFVCESLILQKGHFGTRPATKFNLINDPSQKNEIKTTKKKRTTRSALISNNSPQQQERTLFNKKNIYIYTNTHNNHTTTSNIMSEHERTLVDKLNKMTNTQMSIQCTCLPYLRLLSINTPIYISYRKVFVNSLLHLPQSIIY